MTATAAEIHAADITGIVYDCADDVPMTLWRWENFLPTEIACKGTGKVMIDEYSMDCLQRLRDLAGKPIYLTSAYRSPIHNKNVGGAVNSMHKQARAFDVDMRNHDPQDFESMARHCGFTGFGFYPPEDGHFIHVDTGRARQWGTRWIADDDAAPEEPIAEAPAPAKRRRRSRFR